jgi:hypothetical protein
MDSMMDTFVTSGYNYEEYETSISSSINFLHNITSTSLNNTLLLSKKSTSHALSM